MKLKNTLPLLVAAAIHTSILAPLLGAAVNYQSARLIDYKANKGYYDDAAKWEHKKVPEGNETVCIKPVGGVVTLSSAVPDVNGLMVGSAGKGSTLYITDGAKLTYKAYVRAYSNADDTRAFIDMSGGQISSQAGILRVGTSATYSAHGVMTISGGTVHSAIYVGAPAVAKGSGKLVIKGSLPRFVESEKTHVSSIDETGTLEFILDKDGVAKLEFPSRVFKFGNGARIDVDAAAYRGSAKRIPLIIASKWINIEGLKMSVTAQPPEAVATIEVGKIGKENAIFLNLKPNR